MFDSCSPLNFCLTVDSSGDLWYGNAATNFATDEPVVFDASAFYGHNECRYQFLKSLSDHEEGCSRIVP